MKPSKQELREYSKGRHPFGTLVPTIVVTPPNTCACGWRRSPAGHNCLSPLDVKIWQFAYRDGNLLYAVSRIDPTRMAVAKLKTNEQPISDKVFCELLGITSIDDLVPHDRDRTPRHAVLDTLRSIATNDDLKPLRMFTARMNVLFPQMCGELEWKCVKFTDLPPMWRRVALGDLTIHIEPAERQFRGRDPFEAPKVSDPPTVGWAHVRDGALMSPKPIRVVR